MYTIDNNTYCTTNVCIIITTITVTTLLHIVNRIRFVCTDFPSSRPTGAVDWTTMTTAVSQLKLLCPNNCGRSYNHRGTLRRHLKYECGVPPQFKCEYCPRTFAQKVNLNKHQMAVHKDILNATSMCFVELCDK